MITMLVLAMEGFQTTTQKQTLMFKKGSLLYLLVCFALVQKLFLLILAFISTGGFSLRWPVQIKWFWTRFC